MSSPAVGFNNNVCHRERTFHIQTEDSGVLRPHIDTHLFVDGGRIIKTIRREYSDQLNSPDLAGIVRRMMKEQHRAMFVALRAGKLDAIIDRLNGEAPTSDPPPTLLASAEPAPAPRPPPLPVQARLAPPPLPLSEHLFAAYSSAPPSFSLDADAPVSSLDVVSLGLPPATLSPGTLSPATLPPLALSGPQSAQVAGSTPPQRPSNPVSSRHLGRPQALYDVKPNARSIFGTQSAREQSLDDAIQTYLEAPKEGPASKK